jgi:hypothetical protein
MEGWYVLIKQSGRPLILHETDFAIGITSHEISHTTETDDSPRTRVLLHEGEASGAGRISGEAPYG